MIRPRNIKEWVVTATTALGVMILIFLPVYTVRQISAESERVLQQMEQNQIVATERAIRINVTTISCMLLIEPQERTVFDMALCVREGLANFDDPIIQP